MIDQELIRKHLSRIIPLLEVTVKQHQATSKTGKVYTVKQYDRQIVGLEKEIARERKLLRRTYADNDRLEIRTYIKELEGRVARAKSENGMPQFSMYQSQAEHGNAMKQELKRVTSKMSKKQRGASARLGSVQHYRSEQK
jgi:hypothetical protein